MGSKKNILLLGAGRSVGSLIQYLKPYALKNEWHLTVGDVSLSQAQEKIKGFTLSKAIVFDVFNQKLLTNEINNADVVISMLPAHLHLPVAKECVDLGKSLFTASYVSKEIQELSEKAKDKGILILMEAGLDPGIDHISAMHEIDLIKEKGGEITLFKSFTGGLVAPESDDNPWNYKFTWNPRNVVLAGQGTVKFVRNGFYKYITYHNLFKRLETVSIDGYGDFEGYANRDSLKYRELYGLENIPTIFRGTLRKKGFCEAWDVFVQLGMTDDSYELEGVDSMTYREFINTYLVYSESKSVEAKLIDFFKLDSNSEVLSKLKWLGVLDNKPIGLQKATPAQILQKLLETKWQLKSSDKDMVVMQHQFEYLLNGELHKKTTSLVVKGEDADHTSMAKTVGLPLGIAVRLYLEGDIKLTGVHIPVVKELYKPILAELEEYGVSFF